MPSTSEVSSCRARELKTATSPVGQVLRVESAGNDTVEIGILVGVEDVVDIAVTQFDLFGLAGLGLQLLAEIRRRIGEILQKADSVAGDLLAEEGDGDTGDALVGVGVDLDVAAAGQFNGDVLVLSKSMEKPLPSLVLVYNAGVGPMPALAIAAAASRGAGASVDRRSSVAAGSSAAAASVAAGSSGSAAGPQWRRERAPTCRRRSAPRASGSQGPEQSFYSSW